MRDNRDDIPAWSEIWMAELDRRVPPLDEEVMKEEIVTGEVTMARTAKGSWLREALDKILSTPPWVKGVIGVCAAFLVIIATVFAFSGIGGVAGESYYIIDINPSIVMEVGDDGNVTEVKSLNSDADLLIDVEKFASFAVGQSIERATVDYVDLCIKYGFFDPTGDVVKISTSKGDAVDRVINDMRSSLAELGVYAAVACEVLEVSSIAERLGVNEISEIKELDGLYRNRFAETVNEDELDRLYSDTVISGELMEYILESFDKNSERMLRHAEALLALSDMNRLIREHEDNPTKILLLGEDYFDIVNGNYSYNGEFAELMEEMALALSSYESEYNVEIKDSSELALRHATYSVTVTEMLIELLEHLTEEMFVEHGDEMISLLSAIGVVSDSAKELMEAPNNREEYLSRLETFCHIEAESRLQEFSDLYESKRESISDEDYEVFINGIVAEYGSVDEYFKNKK